ncbi:ferredoxin [Haloechinothrix alba]|uniref:Ferredoxin n=3 Tax=Haloechinothrix TaxID=1425377 RepID=A0A238ZH47_9PSEU|nr:MULTISPECIES: ferredoxin [Haloechinothrix]MBA0126824.1 ferredoxin [Haloechinothrix aidingensis]SNR82795.1 ferredoxin [Haloechinothrix alba]
MKVVVDYGKCTGLGICESLAPDVFEVNDDGELELKQSSVPEGQLEDVEAAVEGCPTEALRLEPDDSSADTE